MKHFVSFSTRVLQLVIGNAFREPIITEETVHEIQFSTIILPPWRAQLFLSLFTARLDNFHYEVTRCAKLFLGCLRTGQRGNKNLTTLFVRHVTRYVRRIDSTSVRHLYSIHFVVLLIPEILGCPWDTPGETKITAVRYLRNPSVLVSPESFVI